MLRLLGRAFRGQYAGLHGGGVERLMRRCGGVLHSARSAVIVGVVAGMRAERRGRRGPHQICGRPVRVQGRGFGRHRVHVVQAGVGALLLGSQAEPLGLRLQGLLLAHRAAVVEGRLRSLLLLFRLLRLFPKLVFGDGLCRLA